MLGGGAATAGEPTRDDWSAGADAICKRISDRNEHLLKESLDLVERERFKRAGRLFSTVFRRSLAGFRDIATLPKPEADRELIQRYITGERRSLEVAIQAGEALGDAAVNRYLKLIKRAARIDRQAQRAVRGFEIPYCTGDA